MKKTLMTTTSLGLFIALSSFSPLKSYAMRPSVLQQIEGAIGGTLTPAELAHVDALYAQTGNSVADTARLIRTQRQGAQAAVTAATHTRRLIDQADRHRFDISMRDNMVGILQGERGELLALLRDANVQIRHLTAANRRLAAYADGAIRQAAELIGMLQQERANHARTAEQLQETQENLRRMTVEYAGYMVRAQREIEGLHRALGDARGGNAELEGAIRQLQGQLADSQRKYQEVEAALINIAKATFVWENGMTPAAAERAIIQSFRREIQRTGEWQELYLQTSRSIDSLLQQQYAKEQELLKALAESAQLKEQLRRQVFDLEGQAAQIRTLQQEKGDLAKDAEAWKQALSEAEDRRDQLELYVTSLTAAIDKIADKLEIPHGDILPMIHSILDKIDAYQAQFQSDEQKLRDNEVHIQKIEASLQPQLGLSEEAVRDSQTASERNKALLETIERLRRELADALDAQKKIERTLQQSALEARDKMEEQINRLSRDLAAAQRKADVANKQAAQAHEEGDEILQEAEEARNKIKRLEAEIAFLQQGVQEIPRNMVQLNQKSLADLEHMRILVREKITAMTQFIRDKGNPQASKLKPSYERIAALLDAAISNLEIALQKSSSGTLQSPVGIPPRSMSESARRLYGGSSSVGPASPRTPRGRNVPESALGGSLVTSRRNLDAQLGAAAEGKSQKTGLFTAKGLGQRIPGTATRTFDRFDPE